MGQNFNMPFEIFKITDLQTCGRFNFTFMFLNLLFTKTIIVAIIMSIFIIIIYLICVYECKYKHFRVISEL